MFPRRIYRDTPQAYRGDKKALKLCEQGVKLDHFKKLTAVQQLFFFMPLAARRVTAGAKSVCEDSTARSHDA